MTITKMQALKLARTLQKGRSVEIAPRHWVHLHSHGWYVVSINGRLTAKIRDDYMPIHVIRTAAVLADIEIIN